jgi:hydrogenase expression/formation protein HypC
MSIPSRIVAIDGDLATVEAFGVIRTCSLMLLAEAVAVGDYVVLGAGGSFAADTVPEETALAALAYLAEVLEAGQA